MQAAAATERFEDAARYRNRLFAIKHLAERQAADRRTVGSVDVVGLAVDGATAAVQVFPLRDGKLIDRYSFHLDNVEGQEPSTLVETFCLEYYGSSPSVPPEILVPEVSGDMSALAMFLSERRGSRVEVRTPARGEKRRLLELAEQNARLALESAAIASEQRRARRVRRARGASRGAQPREPADPRRVLRRLDDPGLGHRRVDGRVRGRRPEEGALPKVLGAQPRRAGRLRRDGRGDGRRLSPVRAARRPTRTTTRASRPCRTSSSSTAGVDSSRRPSTPCTTSTSPASPSSRWRSARRRCSSPATARPVRLDRSSAGLRPSSSASGTRRTASRSAITGPAATRWRASRSSTTWPASARCGAAP